MFKYIVKSVSKLTVKLIFQSSKTGFHKIVLLLFMMSIKNKIICQSWYADVSAQSGLVHFCRYQMYLFINF